MIFLKFKALLSNTGIWNVWLCLYKEWEAVQLNNDLASYNDEKLFYILHILETFGLKPSPNPTNEQSEYEILIFTNYHQIFHQG